MVPRISAIVPSYNPNPLLFKRLYDSLLAQTLSEFEVWIVDDGSTTTDAYACITDDRFHVIYQHHNRGPASCRNRGARTAQSEFIFFTDTDCTLEEETLHYAREALKHYDIAVGDTITDAMTCFGKAVALMGFPGGGILGFDQVWRVDAEGFSSSFSSCNVAFRKCIFEQMGGFDESFPVAGGEDTVLARQMVNAGIRMRYVPQMRVHHIEKNKWADFVRWQITRGRGNYHIRRRVGKVGGYLRLRVWTLKNSLRAAGWIYCIPVIGLFALSVVFQLVGMFLESRKKG